MEKKIGETVFTGTAEELISKLKQEEREYLNKQPPDEEGAFDCKNCGEHFIPAQGQWIFYELCDKCFLPFDGQKMRARLSDFFGGEKIHGYEDVNDWIAEQKK